MNIINELFDTALCKKLKLKYKIILWLGSFLLFLAFMFQANAFLSKNEPLKSETLVVEGWLPDYALQQVMEKFKTEKYRNVITTGGPLKTGSYLKEYKDYAQLAKATLVAMGMDEKDVIAVKAPDVKRERTFYSALALKGWMDDHDVHPSSLDLVSLGPHARRSTMLFQKAFKDEVKIGSIAITPEDYDPDKWYGSSEGLRVTINELIAYIYVVLLK